MPGARRVTSQHSRRRFPANSNSSRLRSPKRHHETGPAQRRLREQDECRGACPAWGPHSACQGEAAVPAPPRNALRGRGSTGVSEHQCRFAQRGRDEAGEFVTSCCPVPLLREASGVTSPPPQPQEAQQWDSPAHPLGTAPGHSGRCPPRPPSTSRHCRRKRPRDRGLAGTEQPCRSVSEHVRGAPAWPHSVQITCQSKAPADQIKESKGPLAGGQARLPLQKPQRGRSVGHAAGCQEQPLCPARGSCREQNLHLTPAGGFRAPGTRACGVLGSWASSCWTAWRRQVHRSHAWRLCCLPAPRKRRREGRTQASQHCGHRCRAGSPWAASGCTVPAQASRQSTSPLRPAGASRRGQGPEVL